LNSRRNGFALLSIAVGALLILTSLVTGASALIAFEKNVAPLRTITSIRAYVWRLVSDFALPLIGGIILVYGGLALERMDMRVGVRKVRMDHKRMLKTQKEKVLDVFLSNDEKKIVNMIKGEENGMLQSDIVIKSGYSKVKVHRILKSLENKGVIKRGRLGITNRVILNL
jgi:uncharacterized membrane protein